MISTPVLNKGLGWLQSQPDPRNYKLTLPTASLPDSADNRVNFPPVLDQGQLGSCTANASGVAFDHGRKRQGLGFISPSRLKIYYDERVIENSVDSDAGAQMSDAIKVLANQGACPETDWPYDISKFKTKPPQKAYDDAVKDVLVKYYQVNQTDNDIMAAIAAGYAVIFGFTVFNSFEHITTNGLVSMPTSQDIQQGPLGGHAGVLCAYHHDAQGHLFYDDQNSWGVGFGDKGHVYFPANYFNASSQLASDFWALEVIADSTSPTPPSPNPFYVGAGIAAAMVASGDSPASSEWYPLDSAGKAVGFSIAYGKSGKEYVYIASLDEVVVK